MLTVIERAFSSAWYRFKVALYLWELRRLLPLVQDRVATGGHQHYVFLCNHIHPGFPKRILTGRLAQHGINDDGCGFSDGQCPRRIYERSQMSPGYNRAYYREQANRNRISFIELEIVWATNYLLYRA